MNISNEWAKFGQTSTLIKYWTKKMTIDFFRDYISDDDYANKYNKIMGGTLLFKGGENQFVKTWLGLTLSNPELIIDPIDEDLKSSNNQLAYHKHDESIIIALAHFYNDSVLVLTETSERSKEGPIVVSRIRAKTSFD